jgi:hypothetical protein
VHQTLIKNGFKVYFLKIIIDLCFLDFAAETHDITTNSNILEMIGCIEAIKFVDCSYTKLIV